MRVIAELGGKNAIVVDSDADLDEVVPAVISSTFGFAGQKCSAASRLVCVESVHDAVVERVVEAARSLVIGPTRLPGSQMGPVIDAEAHARLMDAVGRAGECGAVALRRTDVPERGYFVGPVVVSRVDPASWLARDELFGPVLATFSVKDLDAAVDLANATDYALTAGIFSRSPAHVRSVTVRSASRQRLREPHDHGRGRRPPAFRRKWAVRCRLQGGRARLPSPVLRSPGDLGEHRAPGLRVGRGIDREVTWTGKTQDKDVGKEWRDGDRRAQARSCASTGMSWTRCCSPRCSTPSSTPAPRTGSSSWTSARHRWTRATFASKSPRRTRRASTRC